jgi:alpha-tubulin suppressor-like RCC1 family protein
MKSLQVVRFARGPALRSVAAAALLAASAAAAASAFYVVVPVPNRTAAAQNIAVSLGGTSLPAAMVGRPYAAFDFNRLLAVTGDPGYSGYGVRWSVASGSLPAGLTLGADGRLSGTPTAAETSTFQVMASYKTKAGQRSYQIVVANITVGLASGAPPEAIVGLPYSYDLRSLLTVSGDTNYAGTGVTWSIVSSSLPDGLYLTKDGWIGGTPMAAGAGSVTARATYRGVNGDQAYEVVSLAITVTLSGATLPNGKVGAAYSGFDFRPQLAVTGDDAYDISKVTFSSSGLPDGLTLADGALSGTPTAKTAPTGDSFQVTASYKGVTGQQTYTLLVNGQYMDVTAIATGDAFTCAITTVGGVKCWGSGNQGQLGNGLTSDSRVPVDVIGLTAGVTSIGLGDHHACASTASGAALCWGYNNDGQLGNGTATNSSVPVAVLGLSSGVSRVVVGGYHSCVLTSTRGAKCWGDNNSGQVGDNSATPSSVPVDVPGLTSGLIDLSAGQYHTCAITSSGAGMCWGTNTHGEIGDGGAITSNSTTKSTGPQPVQGLPAASRIAAGAYHTCAIVTGGGVYCWGYNAWGQLGNGSTGDSSVPRAVTGISAGAAAIATGSGFACAKLSAGGVKCWGYNNVKQLGNGTTANSSTPVDVLGLDGSPATLAIGNFANHACVLQNTNALCWGGNTYGQLGNNSPATSSAPVTVLNP